MPPYLPTEKILIIGSGPVRIGQTGAFDDAACQACAVFRKAGLQTVMVHCDPSALATDFETADRTYMVPLTVESLVEVILKERPSALLPTVGGATALGLAKALAQNSLLKNNGIRLLGASEKTLGLVGDPSAFCKIVKKIGLATPNVQTVHNVADAKDIAERVGYPVFFRVTNPDGKGHQGRAFNIEEFSKLAIGNNLPSAKVGVLHVLKALSGHRELDVELLRDSNNRVQVVAMAENMDPVGIHSGDSTAVIPPLTIEEPTRRQIEAAAIKLAEHVGVTGSLNLKFAVAPNSDQVLVLAVTPRFSRTTAFISKAFGIDLATINAQLSLGINLREPLIEDGSRIACATAGNTVAVRLPRWEFKRFPGDTARLDARMKSTGAVIGLGRTFLEALQKAVRCRSPKNPFWAIQAKYALLDVNVLVRLLVVPSPDRLMLIYEALKKGAKPEALAMVTGIHRQWIHQLTNLVGLDDHGRSRTGFNTSARKQARPTHIDKSVLMVGPGSSRIGHSIELDHCCVHGARALRATGRQAVMINANPDAVGGLNDFDRTYVEPLTTDDLKAVYRSENPEGVILQFGGYAAMDLAGELSDAGLPVWGTAHGQVTLSQDRLRFSSLLKDMGIPHPHIGMAHSPEQAMDLAEAIGYPLVTSVPADSQRNRYGIVMDADMIEQDLMNTTVSAESPMLLEQFLEYAIEVEADALCDGRAVYVPAVMEHIELAGVHSGDSAMVIPPFSTPPRHVDTINAYIRKIALELNVKGLLNARFAVFKDTVYLLAARPWACRTLPLVSKICNVPMAERAVEIMLGMPLDEMDLPRRLLPHYGIRASVFPFDTFTETDPLLGPQMRSTGQAAALAGVFGMAYFTAQEATGVKLPLSGNVLFTVTDADKPSILEPARLFKEMGFGIQATRGTHAFLKRNGIQAEIVKKLGFGRPDLVDSIKTGEIAIVINTPSGRLSQQDDAHIRKIVTRYNIPNITTPAGACAAAKGIAARKQGKHSLCSLQSLYTGIG